MVSLRAIQNEERRSSIRIDQHLPPDRIRAGRGRTGVIPGEGDGEWAATGFFEDNSTSPSVVSIGAHEDCHRHANGVEHRSDRTSNGPDVRVNLADVVEQCCFDYLWIIRERCGDAPSDVDGVSLIGRTLGPEEIGAPVLELIMYEELIIGTGGFGTNMSEEASDQMAGLVDPAGHEAACLHLTQRRTAGRYSIRSVPIWVPHVSQIP